MGRTCFRCSATNAGGRSVSYLAPASIVTNENWTAIEAPLSAFSGDPSAVDLDPALSTDTRLVDLEGARGLGITLGVVNASFDSDDAFAIDLQGADTVGDVLDKIQQDLWRARGGLGQRSAKLAIAPRNSTYPITVVAWNSS